MDIIKYTLLFFFYAPLAVASFAIQEKQFPAFAGKWYIESSTFYNNDNYYTEYYLNQCLLPEYKYQFTSSSQEKLINQYIKTLPVYNCVWKVVERNEYSYAPSTYPTNDWYEMIERNTAAAKANEYYLECIEKNSDYSPVHFDYIKISPIYECPKNTRAGNYRWFERACLSETDLCWADIAGRDLAGAGFLGHVGLTTPENQILEVLNESTVIQENSFEDFKTRTTFWGIKYGYKKQEKLTYMEAVNILQAGEYQREFDPKYILFADYREGGFKRKSIFDYFAQEKYVHLVKQRAAFRCDTFIQYSYLKGANILITESVPAFLFKSFKYTREALPFLDNIYDFIFNEHSSEKTDCASDECYKNYIETLINRNAEVDEVIFAFQDYRVFLNEEEKFEDYVFKKYLETAKKPKLNNAILDFIIEINPGDQLIGKLIELYSRKNLLPFMKSNILRQFKYLFIYEPNEIFILGSQRVNNINNVNEIVINILRNSNNFFEFGVACEIAEQIMTEEHYQQLIMEVLNGNYLQNIKLKKKIEDDLVIMQLINKGFNFQDLHPRNEYFNRKLLLILKHIEIKSLPSKTISLLSDYLVKIHKIESIENMDQKQTQQFLDKEILWFSAYKKLNKQHTYLNQLKLFDKKTSALLQVVLKK